jgi:hypothetical protein
LLEVAEKYRGQGGATKEAENLEWRNESFFGIFINVSGNTFN